VNTDQYSSPCSGSLPSARYYSYDEAGRVVYRGITAGGSSVNFAYDADGDPTTMSNTEGANFYSYTDAYDNAGEVTGQTPLVSGHGPTSTYTYDSLGDQVTDSSTSTTDYAYDQLGQLTGTSDASTAAFAYTGDGLEASATPTATGWSSAATADSGHAVDAVSCPASSFCLAVDNDGNAVQWNGSSWSTASSMGDSARPIESVSCPTTTFCVAVDGDGNALTWNGSTWSLATGIDGTKVLTSVSCPTTTACVAVDSSGDVVTWNGSSWTVTSGIDSYAFSSVSCVSASDCQAVDADGRAFTNTGSGWSSSNHSDIDGTHPLTSVSCASPSFCQAVDNHGDAVSYNGSSWTVESAVDVTTPLASVSCAGATFCTAVDSLGDALVYDGATWGPVTAVDPADTPEAVSCPSESFCGLVDGSGKALTYTASDLTWDTNGSLPTVLSDGTNDYLYGPTGEPVEQISTTATQPSSPTFMTFTPSDSSWLLTNAAGNETAFYDYDAFGTLSFGTPGSPFGYAGQYQGTSANTSGLENMRARWYDSQTGEFITRDPDFDETDQAYVYAADDPVNESDPSGRSTMSAAKLSTMAQVAYNFDQLPAIERTEGIDGLSAAQFAGFLWSVAPINCHSCAGSGGWEGDTPYEVAVGGAGNQNQWQCLTTGLAKGGCSLAPNPNPTWTTPKGLLTIGLAVTALVTGGAALEAEGTAEFALAAVAAASSGANAALDVQGCVTQHNIADCVDSSFALIGVAGDFAGLADLDLVASGGYVVGVTGSAVDVFTLGLSSAVGEHCSQSLTKSNISVSVPAPGIKYSLWN
jgi:RHS repeat-associated protein